MQGIVVYKKSHGCSLCFLPHQGTRENGVCKLNLLTHGCSTSYLQSRGKCASSYPVPGNSLQPLELTNARAHRPARVLSSVHNCCVHYDIMCTVLNVGPRLHHFLCCAELCLGCPLSAYRRASSYLSLIARLSAGIANLTSSQSLWHLSSKPPPSCLQKLSFWLQHRCLPGLSLYSAPSLTVETSDF